MVSEGMNGLALQDVGKMKRAELEGEVGHGWISFNVVVGQTKKWMTFSNGFDVSPKEVVAGFGVLRNVHVIQTKQTLAQRKLHQKR
jgi:hypothetical protein